tara:strand:+ start:62 stop:700 length:639 start_codon:yes stop_codon:yes gene_type:complete
MILVSGFFIYSLITNEITTYNKNNKITNNFLSFIHIILCFIIYSIGYFLNYDNISKTLICANTGGFFINEVKLFIKDRNITKTSIALIVHHIMTTTIILNAGFRSNLYFILVMAEFSNLPGCILYYFIQIKKENKLKDIEYKIPYEKAIKYTQAIIYILLRVFLGPIYIYKSVYNDNINATYFYFYPFLYLIGIIWSFKLFKNLNKKKIKNN